MTDRELLQQWLQPGALVPVTPDATRILLDAIRARLAQHNEFNPDWDAVAVMVEEQQRMAKELKTQREWQGLTDEDVWELAQKTPDFSETVAAVEAKLKAKNDR